MIWLMTKYDELCEVAVAGERTSARPYRFAAYLQSLSDRLRRGEIRLPAALRLPATSAVAGGSDGVALMG